MEVPAILALETGRPLSAARRAGHRVLRADGDRAAPDPDYRRFATLVERRETLDVAARAHREPADDAHRDAPGAPRRRAATARRVASHDAPARGDQLDPRHRLRVDHHQGDPDREGRRRLPARRARRGADHRRGAVRGRDARRAERRARGRGAGRPARSWTATASSHPQHGDRRRRPLRLDLERGRRAADDGVGPGAADDGRERAARRARRRRDRDGRDRAQRRPPPAREDPTAAPAPARHDPALGRHRRRRRQARRRDGRAPGRRRSQGAARRRLPAAGDLRRQPPTPRRSCARAARVSAWRSAWCPTCGRRSSART